MKRISLVIALCSITVFTQVDPAGLLKQQYEYADRLYKQGALYDAVTEYERLLCFDTSKTYAFDANKNIADCYRRGAQLKNAIRYTGASLLFAKSKEDIHTQRIELVKLHILNRTYSSAFNILEEVERDSSIGIGKQEADYWRGWIYMFQDKWVLAAKSFANVDGAQDLCRFCLQTDDKQFSVKTIKVLSAIIPGSGQMITGHIWNGLLSLGWNVLWGYLTVDAALAERAGDAFLIGDLLWLRFYTGNIQNAEKFAREKNTQIFQDALRYLQDEFKGAKP
jgi:tetratricopeptide (TPR) repeat protein